MEIDNLSIIGLTIQCAGIVLITILTLFMTRSIRRAFLEYWAAAWVCLTISLLALSIAFRVTRFSAFYFSIYFFGEYAFGYLFMAGCRNYGSGARLTRRHLYLALPAALIAITLSHLPGDFNVPFIPHAAILAGLFAWSFYEINVARRHHLPSPGLRVVSVALALLTIDFLHYAPLLAYVKLTNTVMPFSYLQYTSIYDLILEILLGFGMLMLVMDDARQEVEAVNRELVVAHEKLETLARIDPLTEALNRHAFYSLVANKPSTPSVAQPGCVVVLDLDNLKPINDSLGHTAGDAAIRAVARAVRAVIRADDLLFRWGGDEFLILLFNISASRVHERIADINAALALTQLPNSTTPMPVLVSYGLAPFTSMSEIEQAIEKADGAMYVRKQAHKKRRKRVG
jgi:diguanylate cyclase (GGDEF)-like protein